MNLLNRLRQLMVDTRGIYFLYHICSMEGQHIVCHPVNEEKKFFPVNCVVFALFTLVHLTLSELCQTYPSYKKVFSAFLVYIENSASFLPKGSHKIQSFKFSISKFRTAVFQCAIVGRVRLHGQPTHRDDQQGRGPGRHGPGRHLRPLRQDLPAPRPEAQVRDASPPKDAKSRLQRNIQVRGIATQGSKKKIFRNICMQGSKKTQSQFQPVKKGH